MEALKFKKLGLLFFKILSPLSLESIEASLMILNKRETLFP